MFNGAIHLLMAHHGFLQREYLIARYLRLIENRQNILPLIGCGIGS